MLSILVKKSAFLPFFRNFVIRLSKQHYSCEIEAQKNQISLSFLAKLKVDTVTLSFCSKLSLIFFRHWGSWDIRSLGCDRPVFQVHRISKRMSCDLYQNCFYTKCSKKWSPLVTKVTWLVCCFSLCVLSNTQWRHVLVDEIFIASMLYVMKFHTDTPWKWLPCLSY